MQQIADWLGLTPGVTIVFTGLLAVMATTTVARLLRWVRWSRPDDRRLLKRVAAWWALALLFLAAVVAAPLGPIVLTAGISWVALREYVNLLPSVDRDRRLMPWLYLAVPLHYAALTLGWSTVLGWLIPLAMPALLSAQLIVVQRTAGFLRVVGTAYLGLMLTVFSLSHAVMPLMPRPGTVAREEGVGWLVALVLLVSGSDITQAWWGHRLGRRKMAPSVSPGKTWVGMLGGAATTALLAVLLAPWLTPLRLTAEGALWRSEPISASIWIPCALVVGAAVSVVGLLSDLTISAVKRDAHVKDSGTLLSDQGGMLDRMDSMLFTAPLFYHGLVLPNLG